MFWFGRKGKSGIFEGFCFEGLQGQCDATCHNHGFARVPASRLDQRPGSEELSHAFKKVIVIIVDQGRSMIGYVAPPPGLEQVGGNASCYIFPPS